MAGCRPCTAIEALHPSATCWPFLRYKMFLVGFLPFLSDCLVLLALTPWEWLAVDHALLLKPCILLPSVGLSHANKCFLGVFSGPPLDALQKIPVCSINAIQSSQTDIDI